ncbi:LOW QUALITY PROTEIN: zinc finger HIT domain-containing protein 2 [Pseudonaja textilis]|uniref:LOW QUALITY PROTEIN: zinc finger HIT domain-containing protein 2 n=1 Tax=Pseudonaja textilis TaxID=8673 RepID=UPI000EA9E229|nr:LOW QUALITY PROTEIN: zinc finger HIT domain-containing protein 2 [Pseudonaja textilis]
MEASGGCGLCQAERAPYTCPRCHVRFCSVPCYREHGSCARDFQTRELQLRLRGQRGDAGARGRLREALLRLQELREPGDADPELGLDPQADDLWEQLSPQQRQRFQQLLSSGKISGLLPPWKPWWVVASQGPPMVQLLETKDAQDSQPQRQPGAKADLEASSQPPNEETAVGDRNHRPPAQDSNSLPALPEAIRPLSDLASGPVSPLVRFQLPNVLYAYAYTLSLYNGETDDAQVLPEVCETLVDLSAVLGAQRVFSSTGEALQAALQALTDGQYPECPLGKAGAMEAVGQILRGKQGRFALAAFAHLVRLLGQGKRRVAPQDQPRIYKAKKKCEFLLSWAKEEEEQLPSLALEVQREYVAHVVEAKEVGALTQELEKMWGGKVPPSKPPLIEELD